ISLMATSQLMRVHFPPTSFMGYLSRRSPCACSRAAAPLAQWAPRLRGESKPGSWPIHTPFCTSASIVQPTEQCVHTVFFMSILPPAVGGHGSQTADGQPRVAQKCAAIHRRVNLLLQSRRQTRALGDAVHLFPEH